MRTNAPSARRCSAIALARSTWWLSLSGEGDPIGDREHRHVDALVGGDPLVHLARGAIARIVVGGVENLAPAEDVVEHHQATRAQEAQALLVVVGVLGLVG